LDTWEVITGLLVVSAVPSIASVTVAVPDQCGVS